MVARVTSVIWVVRVIRVTSVFYIRVIRVNRVHKVIRIIRTIRVFKNIRVIRVKNVVRVIRHLRFRHKNAHCSEAIALNSYYFCRGKAIALTSSCVYRSKISPLVTEDRKGRDMMATVFIAAMRCSCT